MFNKHIEKTILLMKRTLATDQKLDLGPYFDHMRSEAMDLWAAAPIIGKLAGYNIVLNKSLTYRTLTPIYCYLLFRDGHVTEESFAGFDT